MTRCIVAFVGAVEQQLLRQQIPLGQLPWWDNALRHGSFFPLSCGPVPYEPPNLTTALSGVSPGHHGCFSFWAIHTPAGRPRILDSSDVRAKRLWEWQQLQDLSFCVINVALTHPPQPLKGTMIAYPMQQTLHATYPSDLLLQLRDRGIRYGHDVSVFYTGGSAAEFVDRVTRVAKFQLDTLSFLGRDCDILVADLTIADRLSHFFWHEVENQPATSIRSSRIMEAYVFLDNALTQLESLVGENGTLLVVSEVGFGRLDAFVSLDTWLQEVGLQVIDDAGQVDVQRSVAREAVQGSHGVNLLLEGRQTGGPVPISAYDRVCDEVRQAILGFQDQNGVRLIADARPRELVYQGPWAHFAPDLIISPADPARPPMGDPRWARHVHRQLQTGWHRDTGFCLAIGPQFEACQGQPQSLEAIAPTVAIAVGRDFPTTCTAKPLQDAQRNYSAQ